MRPVGPEVPPDTEAGPVARAIATVAKQSRAGRRANDSFVAIGIVRISGVLAIEFAAKHSRDPGRAGDSYWAQALARSAWPGRSDPRPSQRVGDGLGAAVPAVASATRAACRLGARRQARRRRRAGSRRSRRCRGSPIRQSRYRCESPTAATAPPHDQPQFRRTISHTSRPRGCVRRGRIRSNCQMLWIRQ